VRLIGEIPAKIQITQRRTLYAAANCLSLTKIKRALGLKSAGIAFGRLCQSVGRGIDRMISPSGAQQKLSRATTRALQAVPPVARLLSTTAADANLGHLEAPLQTMAFP
jgi:hypothetical protein